MEASGTVEKAIDLLFHLQAQGSAQGVTGIGRELGMPKSSAHRLLVSLARRGLVERDGRGRYRLGPGLIALGLGALGCDPVVAAARPILEEQARRLGETFFLVAARCGQIIVLDKVEGTGFLRASPRVGESVPLHATAVGKLYMAFDPDAFPLPRGTALDSFTSQTRDLACLAVDVETARAQGVAASRDEWIRGLSVVAAPVNLGGRMLAAVALAAASARFDELGPDQLAERVMDAGRQIGESLGGATAPTAGEVDG